MIEFHGIESDECSPPTTAFVFSLFPTIMLNKDWRGYRLFISWLFWCIEIS